MKLKRTLVAGALACALTLAPAAAASLTVAGEALPSSTATVLIRDRTYVPLRAVVERLSPAATIQWADATATVTADGLHLTAGVGDCWLEANGRCFYVEDGVRLINNTLMVPVRALAAALGGSVDWDQTRRAVTVTPGTGTPGQAPYTQEELSWLARIISAESQGEPLAGKLAVGTVVLNRVASSDFPDTIYGVIFDRTWGVQFTPVANGTIYNEPTRESVTAAKLCLEGTRVAEGSLYFLDPTKSQSRWAMENRPYITTIGCHWFYG